MGREVSLFFAIFSLLRFTRLPIFSGKPVRLFDWKLIYFRLVMLQMESGSYFSGFLSIFMIVSKHKSPILLGRAVILQLVILIYSIRVKSHTSSSKVASF
jgi:hypothetical protein